MSCWWWRRPTTEKRTSSRTFFNLSVSGGRTLYTLLWVCVCFTDAELSVCDGHVCSHVGSCSPGPGQDFIIGGCDDVQHGSSTPVASTQGSRGTWSLS
ncbi:hypothetical protein AMELA_G00229100 [Ameiurus melas]|uniref:Uncharacterized protein n=1 Tax=Ameiurus melas TaxID=219545 RepID=A0A7J5ZWD7_AMEME|nr:hypothetical protein AMELA_G00229100 [Ameiurus melas]